MNFKIKLYRESGYPVSHEDMQKFKDTYRDEYDKIHLKWHNKEIDIKQYQEMSENLHSELSSSMDITKFEYIYDFEASFTELIKHYGCPILLFYNEGRIEGLIMDSGTVSQL